MHKILVLGATSAIAHATARFFAKDGATFYLVARTDGKLQTVRDDLLAHGAANVDICTADLNDLERHPSLIEGAIEALDGLDVVLIAHGVLGEQSEAQTDLTAMGHIIQTNFTSTASLLTPLANHMEAQRRGVIAVVSSVAGDRGRGTNYVYGSAMAGKSAFVSGLRQRLAKSGVQVLTIKPGFVDTPMTAHLDKNPLYASPDAVGHDIYRAMKSGKDVLYTPFFWRYIMWIIRLIPEGVFKRLNL